MIQDYFTLGEPMLAADKAVMELIAPKLAEIDTTKEDNQLKMLRAFNDSRVAANHLVGITGYGFDDAGRAHREEGFARLPGSHAALFHLQVMTGTHNLTLALS